MTELEKIAYAKSFIDKLANGINPIDDSVVKDDDIINNVRISRCFFYVSDVLRQVIDNGGVSKKKADIPFELSLEERSKFEYSNSPIAISEIAKRLNMLVTNENMKKISYKDIAQWLVSIDILCEYTKPDSKTTKRPTENGMEIGITTEKRTGQRGEYTVTVCNRNAQMFIVDNLDAIITYKNSK